MSGPLSETQPGTLYVQPSGYLDVAVPSAIGSLCAGPSMPGRVKGWRSHFRSISAFYRHFAWKVPAEFPKIVLAGQGAIWNQFRWRALDLRRIAESLRLSLPMGSGEKN